MDWQRRAKLTYLHLRRHWSWVVVTVVVIGLSLAIGRAFWSMRTPEHRVQSTWDQIALPPPPPYLPPTFFDEVRRLGSFPEVLDLRDPQMPVLVAQALSQHPWVEEVRQVSIVPGKGLSIDLKYRTPVAWVRGPFARDPKSQHLIDGAGRWLATSSKVSNEIPRLRITGVTDAPQGNVGSPWGVSGIEQTGRLAAFLASDAEALGLAEIKLDADPLAPDVRLITSGGTEVIWCQFGVGTGEGEPSDDQKLLWLKNYAREMGSLDKPLGPYLLDVRKNDGMTRRPLKAV